MLDDVIAAYEGIAVFQLGAVITIDEGGNPKYGLSKCIKYQMSLMHVEESTPRIIKPTKKAIDDARYDLDSDERAKPDRKGARALFKTRIYAPEIRCFSTESAGRRPSLPVHKCFRLSRKLTIKCFLHTLRKFWGRSEFEDQFQSRIE